jgi:hypothetical protein
MAEDRGQKKKKAEGLFRKNTREGVLAIVGRRI